MSDDKKVPTKCNHCSSSDLIHHVWGRTEYWACKSCKKEVTYEEPKHDPWGWQSYQPTYKGFDSKVTLPPGILTSVNPLPDYHKKLQEEIDRLLKEMYKV